MVTVNVKASDWTGLCLGIAILFIKDSTSELLRTPEYQWPLPGSSRNLNCKKCRGGLLLLVKGTHLAFAVGFQARRILISSRVFHTGTFSSSPLNESVSQRHIFMIVKRSHPCTANMGVSTRFEMWRSLSSGVKDDSKIARRMGSMK